MNLGRDLTPDDKYEISDEWQIDSSQMHFQMSFLNDSLQNMLFQSSEWVLELNCKNLLSSLHYLETWKLMLPMKDGKFFPMFNQFEFIVIIILKQDD